MILLKFKVLLSVAFYMSYCIALSCEFESIPMLLNFSHSRTNVFQGGDDVRTHKIRKLKRQEKRWKIGLDSDPQDHPRLVGHSTSRQVDL